MFTSMGWALQSCPDQMKIVRTSSKMFSVRGKPKGRLRCITVFTITLLATSAVFFASQSTASVVSRLELPPGGTQVRTELHLDSGSKSTQLTLPVHVKKYVKRVATLYRFVFVSA